MNVKQSEQRAVQDLYDNALDLLAAIVHEAHDDPRPDGGLETGLMYRHANNIVWLASDITIL